MTHWDSICDTAIDNYGLITTAQAVEQGVNPAELLRWVKTGRLIKRGHGVFRLSKYVPTDYDYYAESLAFVGDGAAIFGESVLGMQNLALVNPPKIAVATSARLRKKLPEWVYVVPRAVVAHPIAYQGIPLILTGTLTPKVLLERIRRIGDQLAPYTSQFVAVSETNRKPMFERVYQTHAPCVLRDVAVAR